MAKKKAKNVKSKKPKSLAKKPAIVSERAAKRRKPVKATTRKAVPKKAAAALAKKAHKAPVKKPAKKPAKKPTKPTAKADATIRKAAKPPLAKASPRADLGLRRRDGSGHLDPKYAADLRRRSGRPDAEAVGFLSHSRSSDDLAEALGEQFIEGATTGEGAAEDQLDQEVPEERGGPFVRSNAGTEFAEGTDRSNPKGAKREPFPTT
jgi:hypothetical protein